MGPLHSKPLRPGQLCALRGTVDRVLTPGVHGVDGYAVRVVTTTGDQVVSSPSDEVVNTERLVRFAQDQQELAAWLLENHAERLLEGETAGQAARRLLTEALDLEPADPELAAEG